MKRTPIATAAGFVLCLIVWSQRARLFPGSKSMLILQSGYRTPTLTLHDVATGEQQGKIELKDTLHALAMRDNVAFGGGASGAVQEISITGQQLRLARSLVAAPQPAPPEGTFVGDVALQPDGKRLYAADICGNAIAIGDLGSGESRACVYSSLGPTATLALAPLAAPVTAPDSVCRALGLLESIGWIAARHYDIPDSKRHAVTVDTLLDWAARYRMAASRPWRTSASRRAIPHCAARSCISPNVPSAPGSWPSPRPAARAGSCRRTANTASRCSVSAVGIDCPHGVAPGR